MIFMVGMFVGGQGRPRRRDLGKASDSGLKGEKGEQRTGVERDREFGLDFVCAGEDGCWQRERRVQG